LQKSVEVGHMSNLDWLKQPKNDPKEVVTFHNGEQNKLEDVIGNSESKIVQPTKNHLLELHRIKPN
jgi:hypothetical protein